jgi:tetratricopeptide (TPR) repeat protein
MMELGVHFLAVDRAPEARHLLEDAFAALREAPDATAEGRAEVAYNLGLAHLARGQLAVADSLYDQARRVLDGMPAGEPRPLVDLWVAGGRAELAYARGRRAEARAAYHDAVRRAEAAGEPGAEMLVKMLAGLAFVMREEGDEDGAREHLLRARALGDTLADLDPALVRLIDTMLAGES